MARLAIALWLLGTTASAQQPSPTEMAAARELFNTGLEHARAGEWERARTQFERSYAIVEVPTTLLNLAGAQAQTGRLVAAAESYRRFLQQANRGRARDYREQAERQLHELEGTIPRVDVELSGLQEGDSLHLDGAEVPTAILETSIPLDPGAHALEVHRAGSVVIRERFELMLGEARAIQLSVPTMTPRDVVDTPEEHEPMDVPREDRGVVRSPWLWTGVGAVVLGGVLTAILVSRGGNDPYRGNFASGRIVYE